MQPIDEGSHLMSRSIGLAYAVTGAAIASAVIVVTDSTTGLFDGGQATTAFAAVGSAVAPVPTEQAVVDSAADPGVSRGSEDARYRSADERTSGGSAHEDRERFEHNGLGDDDD